MLAVVILLILGGCLQIWAGLATLLRKGELKTTQGRQLEAVFGRKGAAAFFFVCAMLLIGGGVFILTR
jgi:hypothetical protein